MNSGKRKKCFVPALSIMILLMAGVMAWGDVTINETNFPDENFRNYVSSNFDVDAGSEGVLTDAEISAVASINVDSMNIASLKGIEHFTALTDLHCDQNQLTELDVRSNLALSILYCAENKITELDVTKNTDIMLLQTRSNKLTNLNVTHNKNLLFLFCEDNQLTELDVTQNTKMQFLFCGYNKLTELDVSKNTELTQLYCQENKLTVLNVANNKKLDQLDCGHNQITTLNVNNNTALKYLDCRDNQLTTLNVSNNTILENLFCSENQLIVLDVRKNTELQGLGCFNNQLTELDVSKNTKLQSLWCGSDEESSFKNQLTELNVSNNTALTYLNCAFNQLTSLDVSKNTNLTELWCFNNQLTTLDVNKNTKLENLGFQWNKLTSVDLSKNTALVKLHCHNNQLAELNLNSNTALTDILCSSQTFTIESLNTNTSNTSYPYKLDINALKTSRDFTASVSEFISRVNNLTATDSNSNSVTCSLDDEDGAMYFAAWPKTIRYDYDTKNTSGTAVYMDVTITISGNAPNPPAPGSNIAINETNFPDENFRSHVSSNFDTNHDWTLSNEEISAVTSIDVGSKSIDSLKGIEYFTALQYLDCSYNQLNTLDVSKNTALKGLYCGGNKLNTLDVSKNTALTELYCGRNNLTTLDVSKNTALTWLLCNYSKLTTLDVTHNTKLEFLDFGSNDVTVLDVSKNAALEQLVFGENKITAIDVSKNTALMFLDCSRNNLTELDVSKNTALTALYCMSQDLTLSTNNLDITGDPTYPYSLNLNKLKTSLGIADVQDFLSRLHNVYITDNSGNKVTTNSSAGVVYYSAMPKKIMYDYKISGRDAYMDVKVTFEDDPNPKPDPYDPVPISVMRGILSAFSGISESDIYYFSDSELSYEWNLNNNDLNTIAGQNEQVILKLPRMMPSHTGVYVMMRTLTDADIGAQLKLYGITDSNIEGVSSAALENLEYHFFDSNGNEIETVPEDKTVYVAMRLRAGISRGGVLTVPRELKTGTIEVVTPDELSPTVLEKIATIVSIEPEQIHFISDDNIFPTQEPTDEMKKEARERNEEFIGKMNTLTVSQDGYYIVKVTLSDDLYEQLKNVRVSDLKAYALYDDGRNTAQDSSVRSSFIYGFVNTWEILGLMGEDLDFTPQTFLMIGFLEAGEPFTLYLLKTLLMLLAGCDAGLGLCGLAVLGGSFVMITFIRNRKKH